MSEEIRALSYVLAAGLPALYLARLFTVSFVEKDEFRLWRNAWILATLAVFLSGDMLVFAGLMFALSVYVHRKSRAPYTFYLVLLFVGPAVGLNLGLPGIVSTFIELTPARICVLAFLLPTAIGLLSQSRPSGPIVTDWLVVLFALLIVILSLRFGSLTQPLRAIAIVTLDVLLPYFVFSRSIKSRAAIDKAMAALLVASLPLAACGALEFIKGWRLYNAVIQDWDVFLIQPYLFRDGLLRAAATSIEPIAFGFVFMTTIGAILATNRLVSNRSALIAVVGLVAVGMVVSLVAWAVVGNGSTPGGVRSDNHQRCRQPCETLDRGGIDRSHSSGHAARRSDRSVPAFCWIG